MARLAHLSDIHIPLWPKPTSGWMRLWSNVAAELRKHKPDAIILTGDILDSAWPLRFAKKRLDWFMNEVVPATLPKDKDVPFILVPGNHDLKGLFGLGKPSILAAAIFQQTTGWATGWRDPILDTIHVFTIDSNNEPWMARGAVREEDLRAAELSEACKNADHLHIFALHHSVFTAPTRAGENRITTDDASLGLNEPDQLLQQLSQYGYDVVLHGHRHLSTSDTYAEPVAERRSGELWLVGAPSATKEHWQGFNLIDAHTHGRFQVYAVMQAQGRWLPPQIIASRDYEEARTRRWSEQKGQGPRCDILDVRIENYVAGTPELQAIHERCGDIKVTMTLHGPQNIPDSGRLPLPLGRIVGYNGTSWRELHAAFSGGTSRDSLLIEKDGTIFVSEHNEQDIEISGVLLNALPSTAGDWERMRASQTNLRDPFILEPTIPARFLRLDVDCPSLLHLNLVARRAGAPTTEAASNLRGERFFWAMHDDEKNCVEDGIIFRPIVGFGYALTLDGVDPVTGQPPGQELFRIAQWQRTIATGLDNPKPDKAEEALQEKVKHALNQLQGQLIGLGKQLREHANHDELSVDLLSIYAGLRVVMTDGLTTVRTRHNDRENPVGVSLAWGQGVAGRALRLGKEYTWSQKTGGGHVSTLPADNWYCRHDGKDVHAHVYCRPVITFENGEPHAIAMLSFATYATESGLAEIVKQLRQPSGTINVRQFCDDAVDKFTEAFSDALATHPHKRDDDRGTL